MLPLGGAAFNQVFILVSSFYTNTNINGHWPLWSVSNLNTKTNTWNNTNTMPRFVFSVFSTISGPTFAFFTEGHFLGFLNPERMLLGPLNGFASGSISLLMLSSSLNNSSATELVGDRAEEEEEEEEEDDEDPKAVNTVLVEGGATVVTSSSTSSSSCCSLATSSFFPPRSFLFASSAFVKEIGGRGNPCPELWG